MTLTLVMVCLIVLTIGTLLVSRGLATVHQENLNTHSDASPDMRDRPAGAGAERMTEEPPEGGEHA